MLLPLWYLVLFYHVCLHFYAPGSSCQWRCCQNSLSCSKEFCRVCLRSCFLSQNSRHTSWMEKLHKLTQVNLGRNEGKKKQNLFDGLRFYYLFTERALWQSLEILNQSAFGLHFSYVKYFLFMWRVGKILVSFHRKDAPFTFLCFDFLAYFFVSTFLFLHTCACIFKLYWLTFQVWFDSPNDWKWRYSWCNNRGHSTTPKNSPAFSGILQPFLTLKLFNW